MGTRRNYSDEDILYFYGGMIDDIVNDEICETKEEAVKLIKDIISCGIKIWEYDKVMFLVSKVQEIKNNDNLEEVSNYLLLKNKSNKDIIRLLIKKYYPNEYDDSFYESYSEEFTFDNDDKYYIGKVRSVKKK